MEGSPGPRLHVVLVEPEIPPNTGNIARLCLAAGARLHLIQPLGFSLDDRFLARAGMDYWKDCDVHCWKNFDEWERAHGTVRAWFFTTKSSRTFWDARFSAGDALVFGRESKGLPESMLRQHSANCIRIPMVNNARSLNLATAAGIGLYEAWRQLDRPPETDA